MKKFNGALAFFLAIVFVAVGAVGGYFGYVTLNPLEGQVYSNGVMQVHFMELGNDKAGDCTYIKAGETDILIDGGSNYDSVDDISTYIDQYVTDGVLEYVIVTHADMDHIACFAGSSSNQSLFDIYECEIIIDFALTNKDTQVYNRYVEKREAEIAAGATHYTAAQCIQDGKSVFEISKGITMKILDQKYYYEECGDENNYSVCTLFTCGEDNLLFTGDLEKEGEESLVEMNELPKVTLFKAGHLGSPTSSNASLMSVIQPEIVCVCCCAGTDEYTDNVANQFPSQAMIDNVAPYTDRVYIPTVVDGDGYKSLNGNITVSVSRKGVTVSCSVSDVKLKDTEWFNDYRTMPDEWK